MQEKDLRTKQRGYYRKTGILNLRYKKYKDRHVVKNRFKKSPFHEIKYKLFKRQFGRTQHINSNINIRPIDPRIYFFKRPEWKEDYMTIYKESGIEKVMMDSE